VVRVEFRVTGPGGTPGGDVTISGESTLAPCTAPVSAGFCNLTFTAPGSHAITATYSGDDRFAGDTETVDHRVNLVPVPNTAPTAAFTAPTNCVVGQPCQFSDGSSDSDGNIASRLWSFQDGTPPSSADPNPSVTFASEGSKTVTLTVTDDDGAQDTETQQVTVGAAPPPPNQPPVAQPDAYSTPGAGQGMTIEAPGVLANDSDDGGTMSAQNASDPAQGSVSLNSDGGFTYTPDLGAAGTDSFTYEASDGSLTTQATVTITITP
jgi:PKD repeat protein